MIYFDNAATSFPKPKQVSVAVCDAIKNLGNPGRGFYSLSVDAAEKVFETRQKISKLFNVGDPLKVSFTSGITESLNLIIESFIKENDHVITTVFEHNSVLRPLYKKNCGLSIIGIENNDLKYSDFEKELKPNTKAVLCTHASNFTGDIIDIKFIGEFCKKHNILFVLDCAQTAGFLNLDMQENNIDILCFTGHKSLLGPQGTGGICIRSEKIKNIAPVKVGGSGFKTFSHMHSTEMPDCFEAGTINSHSLCGLSASLDFLKDYTIEKIQKHESELCYYFYENLSNMKNIKIYGNFKNKIRSPIVSFNIGDFSSDDLCYELYNLEKISSRSGAHCAPLIHEHFKLESQGAVRFSFSLYNTFKEIDIALEVIDSLTKQI